MQRRSVRFDGQDTTYLEAGPAEGETVVLLHDGGFGSDAESCWGPLLPRLAERYHVLAPDLIGHGGSPKVVDFASDPMSQRLAHIARFAEVLEIDAATYVGNSFGGGMILQAGVRRAWPTLRAGVSICGPGGIFMLPEPFEVLQGYEPSLDAARQIAKMLLTDPSEDEVTRRYEATLQPGHWETLAATRVRNPGVEASSFDWRPKFRAGLGTVDIPMMLIGGENDPLLEPGWEASMAELIPGATSVQIGGTQHQPHIERPDEVADHLERFLDAHTSGGQTSD